ESIGQAIVEVQAMQRGLFEEKVGTTAVDLNGDRAGVRTQETNLGNLIADAARSVTGADAALITGGSIRATIEAGTITRGDVVNVLPFGNNVVVKRVKGSALREALEFALSVYPEQNGGFLQVSGITLRFKPANEAGRRIVELLIGGSPVEDEKEYAVALNAALTKGEGGYAMLAEQPTVYEFGGLDELLIRYLQEQGKVAAKVEGRILAVQ
ncbi:MAG TPA: 5'-nucleotidase, partial [Clostridia bacterium]|nr:5'-nucleotidase [Clostridia bacterium]